MPTGADGAPTSPWGAPTEPPVGPPVAHDDSWADHLPDPGTSIDPEPTGQIPIIPIVAPEAVQRRRARQAAAILAALAVPAALFLLGASLVVAGFGLDLSSPSSNSSSDSSTGSSRSPELPVATAAVVVVGDPAVAATDAAALFASLLQAGRFDEAAAMTNEVWQPGQIGAGYGAFQALQTVVARVSPVGPNEYRLRIAVFSVPTDPADPASLVVARCEQWDVNPTVPRVIPQSDPQTLSDATVLMLRGPELTTKLASTCAAWPMG